MLEVDSKKNEMETGDENSNITERQMVHQSCRMEPRTQLKIQDQHTAEDRGRNGRHRITQWKNFRVKKKVKERTKMVCSSFLKAAAAPQSAAEHTSRTCFYVRRLKNNVTG